MATINLGAIKFNWRGSYSGVASYVVDDVVESGGNSYVCILASTGNTPPNATYWELMAQAGTNGTNGTNGTDLTTTLTTQGDILYRDGSGLQRLGAGTAGQVLQTGGAGANVSWTNQAGGGLRFISKHNLTSNTSEWIFDQIFANNSSYNIFKIYLYNLTHTSTVDDDLAMDLRIGSSGSESSMRGTYTLMYHREKFSGAAGINNYIQTDSAGHGGFRYSFDGMAGGADSRPTFTEITIYNPHKKDGNGNSVNMKTMMTSNTMGTTDTNASGSYFYSGDAWGMYDDNSQVVTGFSLRSANYNLRASSGNQPMVLVFGISES